jgi:hypothetical protein
MNNSELKDCLKSAPVPQRSAEYWEEFPKRVMFEVQRRGAAVRQSGATTPAVTNANPWWSPLLSRAALSAGLALACMVLAFFLGVRHGRHSATSERQLAEAQKCFREIESLFPNQVQALVFDEQGMHLVLAERADVPASPPLYVKIVGPKGAYRFVTFSGQRIRVNGDSFEVLVDRQGGVLLVGQQSVWSSSEPGEQTRPYRIEARPLPANS